MARLSIVYATTEGHTEAICRHAKQYFSKAGTQVVLCDLSKKKQKLQHGDAVLLAGSIHYGKHQKELRHFIEKNREMLQRLPVMFLSISLAAASHEEGEQAGAYKIAADFMTDMKLEPRLIKTVAGAVYDKRLNFLSRWLLHWIMYRKGVALDTSGETVFTNWTELDLGLAQFHKAYLKDNKPASIITRR